jgi:hypothetical protein
MKVLVACEFSGVVRDAFTLQGHDATSCDLERSETPGVHVLGDVLKILDLGWDLMIAHPPCTDLALSGNRWRKDKDPAAIEAALAFAEALWRAPIERIALEQPRSILSRRIGKHTQTIHPYDFGVPEFKTTWLWLKGLPPLMKTLFCVPPAMGTDKHKEWSRVHRAAPGPGRAAKRSRTYPQIAAAMAAQWGCSSHDRGGKHEET